MFKLGKVDVCICEVDMHVVLYRLNSTASLMTGFHR